MHFANVIMKVYEIEAVVVYDPEPRVGKQTTRIQQLFSYLNLQKQKEQMSQQAKHSSKSA
jgi:hypothetical protein